MLYKKASLMITILIKEAESWIDTPYHHQAKVKGYGVDCCNLIAAIAENIGLIPPLELKPYNLQWHLHSKEEMMLNLLEEYGCIQLDVDITNPESWPIGSIICFKYGRACSHLGLLLPDLQVIHAAIDYGKVVKHHLPTEMINRVGAIYKYPNI